MKKKNFYEDVFMKKVRHAWVDKDLMQLTGITDLLDEKATFKKKLTRAELEECYHRTIAMESKHLNAVSRVGDWLNEEYSKECPEDIIRLNDYECAKIRLFKRCNDKFLVEKMVSLLKESDINYMNYESRVAYDEKILEYNDEEMYQKALKRINGLKLSESFDASILAMYVGTSALNIEIGKTADLMSKC